MTEKEEYLEWFASQKNKGLVKIHFELANPLPNNATEEDLYGELNRIIKASDVPDPEVLGPRSI
jgi:hypothetical protein